VVQPTQTVSVMLSIPCICCKWRGCDILAAFTGHCTQNS